MGTFQTTVIKFNNFLFGKIIQRADLSSLFSKINFPQKEHFLEIGCKDGYALKIIKDYFSPKALIGVDIDKKSIELAKRNFSKNKVKDVNLKVADAQNLPFKNETFGAIFMFATLHHVQDWRKAIGEAKRILKSGGYFILREPLANFYNLPLAREIDQPASLFKESELIDNLESSSFEILHWKYRGFYRKVFHASVEAVCRKA